MSYFTDYPTEPIGGGNPYSRCVYCKISVPQINGDLEKHDYDCQYRIAKEKKLELGKNIIILRSASGAGKSTFAELLRKFYSEAVIVCADDYFVSSGGIYKFIPEKIGAAHQTCFDKFRYAVLHQEPLIIVANTNSDWENQAKKYFDFGKSNGYTVTSLVIENRNNTQNVHKVPKNL